MIVSSDWEFSVVSRLENIWKRVKWCVLLLCLKIKL